MQKHDLTEFIESIKAAHELKGLPPHSDKSLGIFFKIMEPYSMREVSQALTALMSDPVEGKYKVPITPAHLIQQIAKLAEQDGRPSPDEAWATVLPGFDERMSLVATAEMLAAMNVARPAMEAGDKIAARKAFLAAYEKAVREARERRIRPEWVFSKGTDPTARAGALERAEAAGVLPAPTVAALLDAPADDQAYDPEQARRNLERIKRMLARAMQNRESKIEARRKAVLDRWQRLVDEHDAKVAKLQSEQVTE